MLFLNLVKFYIDLVIVLLCGIKEENKILFV